MTLRSPLLAAIIATLLMLGALIAPRPPAPLAGDIDRILIDKSDRSMVLYRDGVAVRRYVVALGSAPEGDKVRQGDGRTPEGIFRIDRRNVGSAYHLSLGLDYPHPEDRARAAAGGYSAGGDIFIHGQPNVLRAAVGRMVVDGDWTDGCIAVSNASIEEIFRVTPIGTEVEIRP